MTEVSVGNANPPAWLETSGRNRFGRALLAALVIEGLLLLAILRLSPTPKPVPPSVVKLQVLQPAPVEQAKPPPPVPTPPKPQPSVPVAPPVPPPPPPPRMHHAATKPRPVVRSPPPPAAQTPVPQAPVTEAPPPSPIAQESAISHYTGMLRAIVLSHLEVPDQITESGLTSTSVLRFTVAPDGTISAAGIATPSGIEVVNEAAMDALRASHFPAFISGMPDHPLDFTLPVRVSGQSDQ